MPDDLLRGVEMSERICSVEGCEKPARKRGWCFMHYQRWKTRGELEPVSLRLRGECTVEVCSSPHLARGWCEKHYRRWRRHGDPLVAGKVANGTHRTMSNGYVYVYRPAHPLATATGYVAEHRLVAWEAGLFSDPLMEVHHKDEDKTNNALDNLEPLTKSDHARRHGARA